MKKLICLSLCLSAIQTYAQQYNDYYRSIVNAPTIFKIVNGSFKASDFKVGKVNEVIKNVPYKYSFDVLGVKLQYCYPKVGSDSACSYFIVNNQRIEIKGKFEGDFACDLDISSFHVYQGTFKGRRYILLTCTNTGSGSSTSSVICNLFDLTNLRAIKYYPLWSKYGSKFSFGDFNKDGKLDFLQSRIQGENEVLRISLLTLNAGKFKNEVDKYIIVKQTKSSLKVIEQHWFN